MTKDEAKKFLEDNRICPKHGITLIYRPGYGIIDDDVNTKSAYVCTECEVEKQAEKIQKIAEAKRVLGITK